MQQVVPVSDDGAHEEGWRASLQLPTKWLWGLPRPVAMGVAILSFSSLAPSAEIPGLWLTFCESGPSKITSSVRKSGLLENLAPPSSKSQRIRLVSQTMKKEVTLSPGPAQSPNYLRHVGLLSPHGGTAVLASPAYYHSLLKLFVTMSLVKVTGLFPVFRVH